VKLDVKLVKIESPKKKNMENELCPVPCGLLGKEIQLKTMVGWTFEYVWDNLLVSNEKMMDTKTIKLENLQEETWKLVEALNMDISSVIYATHYFQTLFRIPSFLAEEEESKQKKKEKLWHPWWFGWWIQCLLMGQKYLDDNDEIDDVMTTCAACFGKDEKENLQLKQQLIRREIQLLTELDWKLDLTPFAYICCWVCIRPDKFLLDF